MLPPAKTLACLIVLSASLNAQVADHCRQRSAIVNVLDAHGVPVKGLLVNDFRASHRSRPLNVLSLVQRDDPYGRVVVLLDTSGSMSGELDGDSNKWKVARAAASEFLRLAPPQQRVSLMTFAGAIGQRFEVSEGRQLMEDWLQSKTVIQAKNVKGRTALYESILDALKSLNPTRPGDAIYVITDGGENASRETKARIERALRATGVRLFAFLVAGAARSEEEKFGPGDLLELTRESGGFLLSTSADPFSPDRFLHRNARFQYDDTVVEGVRSYTRLVLAEITSFYVLTLQPPEASSKTASWKLEVVDAGGRSRKDMAAVYPYQLPDCSALSRPH